MPLVVDASVAIKWVVPEEGSHDALALLASAQVAAPDLLVAECAGILWKKARRRELSRDEAPFAARLMMRADVELVPTRPLLAHATELALDLGHSPYDCSYVALALERQCGFATADDRLAVAIARSPSAAVASIVHPFRQAAGASDAC